MKKQIILFTIMLTLLTAACATANKPEEIAATAVPISTDIPIPTNTAVPTTTPTAEPSATPLPTNTATLEPTATATSTPTATPTPLSQIAFAFYNGEANAYQIGVMNANGSERIDFPEAIRNLPDGYTPEWFGYGVDFSWSPDGSRIVFGFMNDGITSPRDPNGGDKSFQLAIMDADGSNLVEVPLRVAFNRYRSAPVYTWAPDGSKLAFVSDSDDELYIINADGTDLSVVESVADLKLQADYDGYSSVFAPSWSPDGNYIAFVWDRNVKSVNLNDETITTIIRPTPPPTTETVNEYLVDPRLTWSTDGEWIVNLQSGVFLFQHIPPEEVIQISSLVGRNWGWSSDGTLLYGQVTDYDDDNYPTESLIFNMADMSLMSNPALGSGDYLYGFSPDMMQMVFLSNRDGNYDIYVADADGSNVNRLTSSESIERIIGWSPDSTKILFASDQNDNNDLYLVNTDGSVETQLTDTVVTEFLAQWKP